MRDTVIEKNIVTKKLKAPKENVSNQPEDYFNKTEEALIGTYIIIIKKEFRFSLSNFIRECSYVKDAYLPSPKVLDASAKIFQEPPPFSGTNV